MPRPKGKPTANPQREIRDDANWAQRRAIAIELRTQRLPYSEVAKRAGYASAGAARNAVWREIHQRQDRAVAEMRCEEGEALDLLQQRIWSLVFAEDGRKPDLWAVDRVLAISKARRDLFGLDAPPPEEIASQNVRRVYERRAG